MFTLAHITDLHLPPMPKMSASDFSVKRILGYLSWHRNRKRVHSADVLKILKADLHLHKPDHIAVTGDQTNIGLDDEYANARDFLKELGMPKDVSVISGNHDAYRRHPVRAFYRFWSDYACDDEKACYFPYIRKRGNVALIGVNSGVRTPPFMAWGHVGEKQLRSLREDLLELGKHGYARVIMIHHPPHENATSFRRGLVDGKAFRDVIKETGAELILAGHLHRSIRAEIAGPNGPVPVRVAGSASSNGQGHIPAAHYQIIQLAENKHYWDIKIEHRQFEPKRRVFEPIDQENLNLPKTYSM